MHRFRLVAVRHGISLGNELNLICGWTDVPLTDQGRVELRRLRAGKVHPVTDRHYSSDLSRCRETFQILYGDTAPLNGILPALREIHFGSLENKSGAQVNIREFFHGWLSGVDTTDAEPYAQFSGRVISGVTTLCSDCFREQARSATVVTHSGVIRTLLTHFTGVQPQEWFTLAVPNGLGYVFDLDCTAGPPRLLKVSPIQAAVEPVHLDSSAPR